MREMKLKLDTGSAPVGLEEIDIIEVALIADCASAAILEIYRQGEKSEINSAQKNGPNSAQENGPHSAQKNGPNSAKKNGPNSAPNCGGNWLDVEYKTDGHGVVSPLTIADKNANKIICEQLLAKISKDIPIISEENVLVDYNERKKYKYYWLIDPLDGTKEFLKRSGDFTVNIGLCLGERAVMGVVTIPTTGEIYMGGEGVGAYKYVKNAVKNEEKMMENAENSPTNVSKNNDFIACTGEDILKNAQKIKVAQFSEKSAYLSIMGSKSHSSPQTITFLQKYPLHTLTSIGSSIKLLKVAEGTAHIYPRLAPTCEWDTAASHAIVTAAGGEVLQVAENEPYNPGEVLKYNKSDPLNPWFVVFGKRV